jgi:SRSO17 transposase
MRPTATTPGLRRWLEHRGLNYVMAVSCDSRFTTPTGPLRADELAADAPRKGWQRLSAGQGSKGHRLYDWLVLDPGADEHLLLVGQLDQEADRVGLLHLPCSRPVPVAEVVRVAGSRWGVEETFQFVKNETGLDHCQVRTYTAWYRHVTLSMLAAAFLAATARTERERDQKGAEIDQQNS